MTTVMLAGMMNVNIAGKVGITRSAIWRLSKRREVKGEDVAVKGDWGKGGRKVVIKGPETKWLKKAKSMPVRIKTGRRCGSWGWNWAPRPHFLNRPMHQK